jgi:hypothetical protein
MPPTSPSKIKNERMYFIRRASDTLYIIIKEEINKTKTESAYFTRVYSSIKIISTADNANRTELNTSLLRLHESLENRKAKKAEIISTVKFKRKYTSI